MPFVILMTHGETNSTAEGLTVAGLLTTMRKANAVLACLPEGQRVPRPQIFCGSDSDCLQTADIFAAQYVSGFSIKPALRDGPEECELMALAREMAASPENIAVISHAKTVSRLVEQLAAVRGEAMASRLPELTMDEVLAVELNGKPIAETLRVSKAPKFDIRI